MKKQTPRLCDYPNCDEPAGDKQYLLNGDIRYFCRAHRYVMNKAITHKIAEAWIDAAIDKNKSIEERQDAAIEKARKES